MHRLWLLFAQTVTVCLGIVFIVTTLRPDWVAPVAPVARQGLPQTGGDERAVSAARSAPDSVDPTAGQGQTPHSYATAVVLAAPSVVSVHTRKDSKVARSQHERRPSRGRGSGDSPGLGERASGTTRLGSGVIMRDNGYIVTNHHVVEAADAIEVTLSDGREVPAMLVGADPESDLAVIQVKLSGLTPITLGDDRELEVGDVVLAIGNPFGVGQSTTAGIVSALGKGKAGVTVHDNFVQTDAAINPGNSGGALVDTRGRLVGINTAIYSERGGSLGIGFAIPVRAAELILNQIIKNGAVARGWLGIEPQDITPELAQAFNLKNARGTIVAHVVGNGPAAKAGVQVGDIVVTMDAEDVNDAMQLLNGIAARAPGSEVSLRVLRDGEPHDFKVTLGTRPGSKQP